MLFLTGLGLLAVASALPTQQILAPAPLAAIPAPNHILILTPQAQVQLEPSLRFPQPLVQHLAPVAQIASPSDQTLVYLPNENLIQPAHQGRQSNENFTNIVNQFVTAGQNAQAQLEAFQQQLTQGLEGLIQPAGGQKIRDEPSGDKEALKPLLETPRLDAGRYYAVPNVPQFYEIIHTPVNPVIAVQPYQAIRARSIALPEEKILVNAPLPLAENLNLEKIAMPAEKLEAELKPKEIGNEGRQIGPIEVPVVHAQPELGALDIHEIKKEEEKLPIDSHFGKYIGSLESGAASKEILKEEAKKQDDIRREEPPKASEMTSFAEALPSGLAISGEGGLSQSKPIGQAIVGKDGVAYSAPSGTAIAGSSDEKKSSN